MSDSDTRRFNLIKEATIIPVDTQFVVALSHSAPTTTDLEKIILLSYRLLNWVCGCQIQENWEANQTIFFMFSPCLLKTRLSRVWRSHRNYQHERIYGLTDVSNGSRNMSCSYLQLRTRSIYDGVGIYLSQSAHEQKSTVRCRMYTCI